MIRRQVRQETNEPRGQRSNPTRGFSLIELIVVVVIGLLMTVIAVPLLNNTISYFRLRGAVSSVTGAIQSTRYQAIFQGCPYQVVFTAATSTYQIKNQCPVGGAFANVCTAALATCPVPLSGSGIPVALTADITLTFSPGGKVTSATAPMSLVITYGGKPPETIAVSSYGSINVNP